MNYHVLQGSRLHWTWSLIDYLCKISGYDNKYLIWGFNDESKYRRVKEGDVVYFKTNKDGRETYGVFGRGKIVEKFEDDVYYWPDEYRGVRKFPFRIKIGDVRIYEPLEESVKRDCPKVDRNLFQANPNQFFDSLERTEIFGNNLVQESFGQGSIVPLHDTRKVVELDSQLGFEPISDSASAEEEGGNMIEVSDNGSLLKRYLSSRGYHFPEHIISSFYTALKTKGFVILSGLSGTGKTKLALEFAELLKDRLPEVLGASGGEFNFEEEITKIKETIWRRGYAVYSWDYIGKIRGIELPFILWQYNSDPTSEKYQKVVMGVLVTDFKNVPYDELPEDWKEGLEWIEDVYGPDLKRKLVDKKLFLKIEDIWEVEAPISRFVDLRTSETLSTADASRMRQGFVLVRSDLYSEVILRLRNHIFLSVRPDWRDGKPLIGYYNPLDGKYEATALLEFILRAREDYEQNREKASPYFIILDEMNLAHVEYYFADFLSVLESGRDETGYTKEGIKLHSKSNLDVPREIRLPPNLYIIGTVNVDETTYMFSPKVLDRAFTIEFNDVDFSSYLDLDYKSMDDSDVRALAAKVKEDLSRGGMFTAVTKSSKLIKESLGYLRESGYLDFIDELNRALKAYDLHFGYRVLDELSLFFRNAKESQEKGIIRFESDDEIVDLAILMKFLPKFHGPRRKLERPLLHILNLSLKERIDIATRGTEGVRRELLNKIIGQDLRDEYVSLEEILSNWETYEQKFRFPHTAKKCFRMLRQLYEVGFASFS